MALSKSLLGNSSQWLSQICFAGMSWLEWIVFTPLWRHRATFCRIAQHSQRTAECKRVLVSIWQQASDVTAVEVSKSRYKHRNKNELQQLLKAFAFSRVSDNSGLDQGPDRKRLKAQEQIKCHFCGKMGHKAFECCKKKWEGRFSVACERLCLLLCSEFLSILWFFASVLCLFINKA